MGRALPALALPTAAAAALVLTATGATVSDGSPVALDLTGSQAAVQQERDRRADTNQAIEVRQLLEQKQVAAAHRRAESERAARAAERVAVIEKRTAQVAVEAKTKAREQWVEPVVGCSFSSPYGYRWGRLHAGNDFACEMGTPIRAMSGGTVVFVGEVGGYGNKVEIQYWDGTVSFYGHMNSFAASQGDQVMPGDVVGYSGNSGRSTGPHLHLEIRPGGDSSVDPIPWLAEHHLFTSQLSAMKG